MARTWTNSAQLSDNWIRRAKTPFARKHHSLVGQPILKGAADYPVNAKPAAGLGERVQYLLRRGAYRAAHDLPAAMMDCYFDKIIDSLYAAAPDPDALSAVLERVASCLGASCVKIEWIDFPAATFPTMTAASRPRLVVEHVPGAEPSEAQQALMRRVEPHILRAASLTRKYELLRRGRQQFISILNCMDTPILLVEKEGVLVFANAASETLLRMEDGLCLRSGRIAAPDPAVDRRLAHLLDAAARGRDGGLTIVPRPSGARPLTLHIRPALGPEGPEAAVIFIANPGASQALGVEAVAAAYRLTAAETRLLSALAAGDTLDGAAGKLAIAKATARNQLAHILQKTSASRQSELMRLVHASAAPLRNASPPHDTTRIRP